LVKATEINLVYCEVLVEPCGVEQHHIVESNCVLRRTEYGRSSKAATIELCLRLNY